MKKIVLTLLAAILLGPCFSQNDKPYRFEIKNLPDTNIYLANYYGDKLYYADTAQSVNGEFQFSRVKPEKEGKFAVVIPGPKYFEILIADGEKIFIKTDTADLVAHLEVIESKNNQVMYEYVNFLTDKRIKRDTLTAALQRNEGNPAVTADLKTQFNNLNDEVVAYQKDVIATHPDLFIAREIKMSLDVEPPVEMRENREQGYYYFKNHYFDNMDLNDDRIVNTPIFHTRLINYLNNTLVQDPDTIIKSMDKVIKPLDKSSEVYKYIVHYTTYNAETSKIMGMDKVFVHMVDTYYKPGGAYWMDEERLETIRKKANEKRNTLIGNKAPELILADSNENWISTHRDIKNKYTVLFFYDPDCGHCKKETPKLVEFYNNYSGDVAVYAISSDGDDKWRAFINKNKMSFYNVAIPPKAYKDSEYATNLILTKKTTYQSLKYQETFDVFTTPKIFVLDENKVIRAKDIGVEQLEGIIDRLEGAATEKM
jgi:peroxiredoxin